MFKDMFKKTYTLIDTKYKKPVKDVYKRQVKVVVTVEKDEKEIREYHVDQLKFKARRKKEKVVVNSEELKALEALEKREGKSKLDDN